MGPWRPSAFDWEGFVKNGALFVNLVGGAVATAIVLTSPSSLPDWMIHSEPLLFLSLPLAFARVWKTAREEFETSALWGRLSDELSPRGSGMGGVLDLVFEVPYIFSMVFLPASVVSLQTFVVCLALFYVSDNYYNLAFVRRMAADRSVGPQAGPKPIAAPRRNTRRAAGRILRRFTFGRIEPALALLGEGLETAVPIRRSHANSIDVEVLTHFFGRRVLFDRIAIWLLAGTSILVVLGPPERAKLAGIVVVAILLAMEVIAEPFRSLGVQYESDGTHGDLLLWTAPAGTKLDDGSFAALERIHKEAFPPAEQQLTADFMLANTGRHGYRLLVLTERAKRSNAHELAGYLFFEARPELEVAFFWYLAVDEKRRGQGLGHEMLELALEVVGDRWPSIQAVFLEADAKLVEYYRRLGFWWVKDVEYKIPDNCDRDRSLRYNPMFYPLHGSDEIDTAFVKEAVRAMAADSFENAPGDQRLKDLDTSLANMSLAAPEARKGARR